jgi:hypothetical protein
MKNLTRVVAVLAAVAFAVPALACSEMQQTTAQTKVEQQPVAKAVKAKKAEKATTSQTTVAKAQAAKPAPN